MPGDNFKQQARRAQQAIRRDHQSLEPVGVKPGDNSIILVSLIVDNKHLALYADAKRRRSSCKVMLSTSFSNCIPAPTTCGKQSISSLCTSQETWLTTSMAT